MKRQVREYLLLLGVLSLMLLAVYFGVKHAATPETEVVVVEHQATYEESRTYGLDEHNNLYVRYNDDLTWHYIGRLGE